MRSTRANSMIIIVPSNTEDNGKSERTLRRLNRKRLIRLRTLWIESFLAVSTLLSPEGRGDAQMCLHYWSLRLQAHTLE